MDKRILTECLKSNIKQQISELNGFNNNGNDLYTLKNYSIMFFDALDIAQKSGIVLTPKDVTNLFKEYITEVIDSILIKYKS